MLNKFGTQSMRQAAIFRDHIHHSEFLATNYPKFQGQIPPSYLYDRLCGAVANASHLYEKSHW